MRLTSLEHSQDRLDVRRRPQWPGRRAALSESQRCVLANIGGQDFHHWPVLAVGFDEQSLERVDAAETRFGARRAVAAVTGELLDGAREALVGPQVAADLQPPPPNPPSQPQA